MDPFARLVKAAGVRQQRLHDLRHLLASFNALEGVPINVTSKRLGYSNPAFTMRVYQHLYAETATQAAAVFFPARPAVLGGRYAHIAPTGPKKRVGAASGNTERGADLRRLQSRRGVVFQDIVNTLLKFGSGRMNARVDVKHRDADYLSCQELSYSATNSHCPSRHERDLSHLVIIHKCPLLTPKSNAPGSRLMPLCEKRDG